jgi:glutaminyl-peptide cyclotransferase
MLYDIAVARCAGGRMPVKNIATVLLAGLLFAPAGAARAEVPVAHVEVVKSYPHDPQAFTEGLFYRDGFLYESTGLEGHSSIRKVKLETGEVLQQQALDPQYFGEGIVAWKNRLVQITWQSQIGFVYDLATFKLLRTFHYAGEGWALTHDGCRLIMSDGTDTLRFLDPVGLKEIGHVSVTADGVPVRDLNEVEFVKGEVYANIWQTSRIACIDPKSGHVLRWIDVGNLVAAIGNRGTEAVPNGIAYDAAHDRLFVTGKLWPKIFEIKLVP